jgi:tetratricopeptide (TPR) repeat protein
MLLLAVLWAVPCSGAQIFLPFWGASIDSALKARDTFYKALALPDSIATQFATLSPLQKNDLCENLKTRSDSTTPWYLLVAGLAGCAKVNDSASFSGALALAGENPGATWVLFVEFTRNSRPDWADRCLAQMEKQLFLSGGRASPAVAQQLYSYARASETANDPAGAERFYAWAGRFDPDKPWPLLHRALNSLPSGTERLSSSVSAIGEMLLRSWTMQLAAISGIYSWLSSLLMLATMIVFAGLGLRYLPRALHRFTDRIPATLPATIRTLLPVTVLLSTLSFGAMPFLWLLALCIAPFIDKKDKVIFVCAAFLFALAPLDTRIRDMLIQAQMPRASLSLYSRAVQEGYSADVHRTAVRNIITDRSDALAYLTTYFCFLKKGDTAGVNMSISRALALRPDDPVVLCCAGNTAYASGDLTAACDYYQKILATDAKNIRVRYNLAQCYARKAETAIDLDFMKFFSAAERKTIDKFIEQNNAFFPGKWPVSGQLIPPDYKPAYFWRHVFAASSGSWETADRLWGGSLLGVPLVPSFVIFIILFLAAVIRSLGARKKPLTCRLCKRVVCATCKTGELCPSCHAATTFIKNVKTLAIIQSRIARSRIRWQAVTEYLLDTCVPGTGMIYASRRRAVIVVILTASVYASVLLLSEVAFVYPHAVIARATGSVPMVFFYNAFFLLRAVAALFRKRGAIQA